MRAGERAEARKDKNPFLQLMSYERETEIEIELERDGGVILYIYVDCVSPQSNASNVFEVVFVFGSCFFEIYGVGGFSVFKACSAGGERNLSFSLSISHTYTY